MTLALALARSTLQFVSDIFFFHVHLIIFFFTHMNIIKRGVHRKWAWSNLPGRFAPDLLFRKPPFFFPGYAPAGYTVQR